MLFPTAVIISVTRVITSLWWRHNERHGISNNQPHDCLRNRLFFRRSKETSKLRVTGLCEGNSPEFGEFPAQMASNAENVSFDVVIMYHHTSNRSRVLVGNELVDHSDVVGPSPDGAAPITSSFSN